MRKIWCFLKKYRFWVVLLRNKFVAVDCILVDVLHLHVSIGMQVDMRSKQVHGSNVTAILGFNMFAIFSAMIAFLFIYVSTFVLFSNIVWTFEPWANFPNLNSLPNVGHPSHLK